MSWASRRYATIPAGEMTTDRWDVVMQDPSGARRSLDGSMVLVKWEGPTPAPLAGVTIYTHGEILGVMSSPAWSAPDPEEPDQ